MLVPPSALEAVKDARHTPPRPATADHGAGGCLPLKACQLRTTSCTCESGRPVRSSACASSFQCSHDCHRPAVSPPPPPPLLKSYLSLPSWLRTSVRVVVAGIAAAGIAAAGIAAAGIAAALVTWPSGPRMPGGCRV
jgi:hypothetical protein